MLEQLETRKLLSATLTDAGLLVVEGTAEADVILIGRREGRIVVRINHDEPQHFAPDAVRAIQVSALGGNDRVTIEGVFKPATILGGAGNDRLIGGDGPEVFYGGDGNDFMDGRRGADQYNGGGGIDTVSYESRNTRVVVSMNGVADDGTPAHEDFAGEKDNVKKDVEVLIGGGGNDRLLGNELANRILGGRGNDEIYCGAGNDTAVGGPGNDRLFGQDGNDTFLIRDGQRDAAVGGAGEDRANKDDLDHTEGIENFFNAPTATR